MFLLLSSFQLSISSDSENNSRPSNRSNCCTSLANSALVYSVGVSPDFTTSRSSSCERSSQTSHCTRGCTSAIKETDSDYLSNIRKQLKHLGITDRAINIILSSWRNGTTKQYQSYLTRWLAFCQQNNHHILSPPISAVLDFLAMLYDYHNHECMFISL